MTWDGYPRRKWAGHPPELWIGAILYIVVGAMAIGLSRAVGPSSGWRFTIGVLPVVPLLMTIRGYIRMVRHQDELYRQVQFEAIAFAAALTIAFCFTVWFLEAVSGLGPISIQWAGILLFFSYAGASGFLMRRYT